VSLVPLENSEKVTAVSQSKFRSVCNALLVEGALNHRSIGSHTLVLGQFRQFAVNTGVSDIHTISFAKVIDKLYNG